MARVARKATNANIYISWGFNSRELTLLHESARVAECVKRVHRPGHVVSGRIFAGALHVHVTTNRVCVRDPRNIYHTCSCTVEVDLQSLWSVMIVFLQMYNFHPCKRRTIHAYINFDTDIKLLLISRASSGLEYFECTGAQETATREEFFIVRYKAKRLDNCMIFSSFRWNKSFNALVLAWETLELKHDARNRMRGVSDIMLTDER